MCLFSGNHIFSPYWSCFFSIYAVMTDFQYLSYILASYAKF